MYNSHFGRLENDEALDVSKVENVGKAADRNISKAFKSPINSSPCAPH